jgi:hypothetical protein
VPEVHRQRLCREEPQVEEVVHWDGRRCSAQ